MEVKRTQNDSEDDNESTDSIHLNDLPPLQLQTNHSEYPANQENQEFHDIQIIQEVTPQEVQQSQNYQTNQDHPMNQDFHENESIDDSALNTNVTTFIAQNQNLQHNSTQNSPISAMNTSSASNAYNAYEVVQNAYQIQNLIQDTQHPHQQMQQQVINPYSKDQIQMNLNNQSQFESQIDSQVDSQIQTQSQTQSQIQSPTESNQDLFVLTDNSYYPNAQVNYAIDSTELAVQQQQLSTVLKTKFWGQLTDEGEIPNFPQNQRYDYIQSSDSQSLQSNSKQKKSQFLQFLSNHKAIVITTTIFYFLLFFLGFLFLFLFIINILYSVVVFILAIVFSCVIFHIYACYWVVVMLDPTAYLLMSYKSYKEVREYINLIKTKPPRIWMRFQAKYQEPQKLEVKNDPFKRRVLDQTTHSSNGVAYYGSPSTTSAPSKTFIKEERDFIYTQWEDASGVLNLDPSNLQKKFISLNVQKKLIFKDSDTANSYMEQYNQFKASQYEQIHPKENEYKIEMKEGMDVPYFSHKLLLRNGYHNQNQDKQQGLGKYYNIGIYCLLAFIPGLLFPYMYNMDKQCGEQKFTLFKTVTLSPNQNNSNNLNTNYIYPPPIQQDTQVYQQNNYNPNVSYNSSVTQ